MRPPVSTALLLSFATVACPTSQEEGPPGPRGQDGAGCEVSDEGRVVRIVCASSEVQIDKAPTLEEVVESLGGPDDGNPLNHERYSDSEAVAAVLDAGLAPAPSTDEIITTITAAGFVAGAHTVDTDTLGTLACNPGDSVAATQSGWDCAAPQLPEWRDANGVRIERVLPVWGGSFSSPLMWDDGDGRIWTVLPYLGLLRHVAAVSVYYEQPGCQGTAYGSVSAIRGFDDGTFQPEIRYLPGAVIRSPDARFWQASRTEVPVSLSMCSELSSGGCVDVMCELQTGVPLSLIGNVDSIPEFPYAPPVTLNW